MASVKNAARWALGVPALGRAIEPGEVVEVTEDQFAGMANQVGVWEAVEPPAGWVQGPDGCWHIPTPESVAPPADIPPVADPPLAGDPETNSEEQVN